MRQHLPLCDVSALYLSGCETSNFCEKNIGKVIAVLYHPKKMYYN